MKFYVYAGYYELFISSEPMPEPYMYQAEFDNLDEAINFAEEWDDTIHYCENIREYMPEWLREILDENDEWFNLQKVN